MSEETRMELNDSDVNNSSPEESTILNILNDDCILNVFKYLTTSNLCVAAEVCTRFKYNAIDAVKVRSLKLELKSRYPNVYVIAKNDTFVDSYPPMTLLGSLFRNFGRYMKEIKIRLYRHSHYNRIMNFLATYCSDENCFLIKVELTVYDMDQELMQRLGPMFARLKCLRIETDENMDELVHVVSACRELTFLYLKYCPLDHSQCLTDEMIDQLFQWNRQLKELQIFYNCKMTSNLYRSIGLHLPDLETLEVIPLAEGELPEQHLEKEDLVPLADLKKLKILKLMSLLFQVDAVEALIHDLAEAMVPIIELVLFNAPLNENVIKSLSKLNRIESLKILYCQLKDNLIPRSVEGMLALKEIYLFLIDISLSDVKGIVKNSKNLSYLCCLIKEDTIIDENDFIELVNIVKRRGNGSKFVIDNLCRECEFRVLKDVAESNKQWLEFNMYDPDGTTVDDE